MKLDIAINYVCSWLFFDVRTLKQALKNVKPLISQFLQPYHWLLHSKEEKWTMGRIG